MELYCEHPAITSEKYAYGLDASWNNGEPNQVFQFLLEQADQGDLDEAKKKYADKDYEKFLKPLTKHPNQSHPQDQESSSDRKGSTCFRRACPITNVSDEYRTRQIIKEYLLGEKEKTKKGESEEQEAGTENRTD